MVEYTLFRNVIGILFDDISEFNSNIMIEFCKEFMGTCIIKGFVEKEDGFNVPNTTCFQSWLNNEFIFKNLVLLISNVEVCVKSDLENFIKKHLENAILKPLDRFDFFRGNIITNDIILSTY